MSSSRMKQKKEILLSKRVALGRSECLLSRSTTRKQCMCRGVRGMTLLGTNYKHHHHHHRNNHNNKHTHQSQL